MEPGEGNFPFALAFIPTFLEIEIVILHRLFSGPNSGLNIGGKDPGPRELRVPMSVPGQNAESWMLICKLILLFRLGQLNATLDSIFSLNLIIMSLRLMSHEIDLSTFLFFLNL